MEILKFQDRICYDDYLVVTSAIRLTGIKLPFNFIDSIPKEFTDFYAQYNSKEHLNSDFYFWIDVVRDVHYYRKKSGNIINYLKNNLEHIRLGLGEDPRKGYPNRITRSLIEEEEYMFSEDCKELVLEFFNSRHLPNNSKYYYMVNNIINKL